MTDELDLVSLVNSQNSRLTLKQSSFQLNNTLIHAMRKTNCYHSHETLVTSRGHALNSYFIHSLYLLREENLLSSVNCLTRREVKYEVLF